MRSTQDNLTNPMKVDLINLPYDHPIWKTLTVTCVTKIFYDRMEIKDPTVMYVITDYPGMMYLGDALVPIPRDKVKYLMGPCTEHNEYWVYMNIHTNYIDRLIPIARFRNAQYALDAMNRFNRAGSYHPQYIQVRDALIHFILDDISVNDFLIGIIASFGYANDSRLQDLMQFAHEYKADQKKDDIGKYALKAFKAAKEQSPNRLMGYYYDLYQILRTYSFFRTPYYTMDPEAADLSIPIKKICTVMADTSLPEV